jgi:hypothetical protein
MLDKGYFTLMEQVFTLARVQMVNTNPDDKVSLEKMLQLENDLTSRLEEYNTLKEREEMLKPENSGSTIEQINYILNVLATRPFKEVQGIINLINEQAQGQLQPEMEIVEE